MARVGDYLVVEDTNISWGDAHKVRVTYPVDPRNQGWECLCGHRWGPEPLLSVESIRAHRDAPVPRCPMDDGKGDRGARGGIEDYIAGHQGEFIQDPLCERWLLTMHPGGWLRRVAECQHG
jgi:cephalosporin hydroxylase